jgi:hypothetical protein
MVADRQQTTIERGARAHLAVLQASRRLDWRFLLPDPDLGRVAYCGSASGSLVESLKSSSTSLTVIPTGGGRAGDHASAAECYDVVVMRNPTAAELRRGAGLLKPGGWLYIEAYGPFLRQGLRLKWPRFAYEYARALRQLGLDEIEVHWHWPDFESRTEIIPLCDYTALQHLLAHHRSSGGDWLKTLLGGWLLGMRLVAFLVPCFSVLAHRTSPAACDQPSKVSG